MSVICLCNFDVRMTLKLDSYGAIRTRNIPGQFTEPANHMLSLVQQVVANGVEVL